jgi:hypothetical protein
MSESSPPGQPSASSTGPALGIGVVLILVGVLLFAGQALNIGLGDLGWPVWIVAVGLAILLSGLALTREEGMVVGGTVVTTVGLVLFYQNATGLWATWAYAWALVGPAAGGLGMVLWGLRNGNGRDVRNGFWALLGGLAIFAVGYLFFEGVIGLSGDRLPLPEWVLPVVVIGIGVVVLLRGLLERREPEVS